ncbi:nucleoside hydrolase [Actinoalloteichus hymeniacidonis]|uniref:Inosine-uridine nucleoside N-ribohydrolase n=1 Tax=Actinoalloteichus hymeniacidonis TaxID=340345 RepID=A0AAC9MYX6_9PSEU|nr:nucleoside hydrolase [Actinoalloteichus hymeniacidonis]AOS64828.1 Inosine-uridine nucleoside N-ribohydrolase [Actinoalloteichus hymeniacidonis]MBB5907097.1 purine nucleosidase [Actinoalloteichus hymeniacidonis]
MTDIRLIVDTDPGVDDAMALLYLAAQRERVELVSVGSVHGNLGARPGAENALRILEVAGLGSVPVAVGADRPLDFSYLPSGQFVHGADGLSGAAGPAASARPVAENAAVRLVRLCRENPGELTVLALGPLTNLALALHLEPELPNLVRSVVWMGGAIDAPGNITAHAEANAAHDPLAADQVLGAGFPLTVVPLDVTRRVWADADWWASIAAATGARAKAMTAWSRQYLRANSEFEKHRGGPGTLCHDPVAAILLLEPELAEYERHPVLVEFAGGQTRGATLVDRRGYITPADASAGRPSVRIATDIDVRPCLGRLQAALSAED